MFGDIIADVQGVQISELAFHSCLICVSCAGLYPRVPALPVCNLWK